MQAADILDSRYSWLRLALCLAIGIVGNLGMWIVTLILPQVESDFAASRGAAALPFTATMIGFALGNLTLGRLADRIGIRATLSAAAALLGAGYALAALAPSIAVLAAVQVVIGFGTAVSFGPLIADASLWFDRRRGIAVAVAASGNYLSGAVWPPVLSWIAPGADWRTMYLVVAVAMVVLLVPLAQALRRPLPDDAYVRADASAHARTRSTQLSPRRLQAVLALGGIACCVAMSMPQVHIVALCVDLGFGAVVGGQMLSLMLLGGVVSRLASGWLADRLGGVRTLLIGSVGQMIALAFYLPAGDLVSLYSVSFVFGLAQGGIVPSYAVIVREYLPAREAGRRVGFVLMMTIVGMALGGWMSGLLYDISGSYETAILNGLAWNAVNIALMLWLLSRGRGPAAVPA